MRFWIAIAAVAGLVTSLTAQAAAETCKLDKSEHVHSQTPTGPLKMFVFAAPARAEDKARPAIVILHGGGWVSGEPAWTFWLVNRFACKGMVVMVPQYRLSDQKTASPAEAIDDTLAAFGWVRRQAATFKVATARVAGLGWSAGGHLLASAAVFGKDKAQLPNLLALVSPAVSVINDQHFRSLFPPEIPVVDFSPAQHVRPGLPPSVIVTGKTDTVTPLVEVTKFHDAMRAAGNVSTLHVYDGVGHLFTPAGQPDNRMPNPDQAIQARAYAAIDAFLIQHSYLRSE